MESVLSISDLSIRVGQKLLVQNVAFDVNEGDAILLSGLNGVGKSSILKSIMGLEEGDKKITGRILYRGFGNVLELSINDRQKFRASIAYVPQRDEYSTMGGVQVRDVFGASKVISSGSIMSYDEVNMLIDKWIPKSADGKRIFDAKSMPAKFSGGEQRLLAVLSAIATRSDSSLMIIDEPLNNLDFVNVRNISNLINSAIRLNPKLSLLMVSHCRIFPFINRELRITENGVVEVENENICHSCFGEPDAEGFYR